MFEFSNIFKNLNSPLLIDTPQSFQEKTNLSNCLLDILDGKKKIQEKRIVFSQSIEMYKK